MEDRLIVAVSCHPILYDKHVVDFKNLNKKKALWESIAMMCGMTVDKAQAKWKNLVDTYRKILKKEKDQNRSGSAALPGKEWRHAQRMSFMALHIMGRVHIVGNSTRSPPPAHQGTITLAPPTASQGTIILAPAPATQGTVIGNLAPPAAPQGNGTLVPPPAAQGTSSTLPLTAKEEASPDTTHAQPYTPETPDILEAPDIADTPPEFLYEVSEEEDEEDEEEELPVPAKVRRYPSHEPTLTPFQAGLLRAIEETTVPSSQLLSDRDADEMFFMSLVPTVKSFSPKRKAAVKFKIYQLIYENETEALNEASSTQEQ